MVSVWVTLITNKIKRLEEVPERYRAEVEARLSAGG